VRKRVTDPAAFGRVAVLMGGWSAEREVSLWSGKNVLEALTRKNVDASGVDVKDPEVLLGLRASRFERAFNVLHGTGGEDGTAQAVLDLVGVAYPGSGVLGSALAMDKLRSKRIWRSEGLPTADYAEVGSEPDAHAAAKRFGFPLVIKPSAEGSSVGVTIVKSADQVAKAFTDAQGRGRAVMAERFIKGAEITVSMLDGQALPSIRIVPSGEFYDYHAKYVAEDTRYDCPSGLAPEQETQVADIAVKAFDLLGCKGWGRVDFIVEGFPPASGIQHPASAFKPWLLEVNTLPGMTSHSLVPMAAKASGMPFDELCWAILETSLETSLPEAA
jgi:D-alanine-D-alanine ligase